ncbi:hypothetical protein BBD41_16810 [Paenibacillus ihbetae]|uniref:Uncharacterized protein n=1 Tax=Paenibacillus ihbetae TaxID=1870820 RepID=A0A1B2E292_9BACL|nr:hypothetical protein BBD41_16810 [Paenibacillus ihbetae]
MRFQDDEELDGNKGDLGPGRIAVPKSTIWCRDGDFFLCRDGDFFLCRDGDFFCYGACVG